MELTHTKYMKPVTMSMHAIQGRFWRTITYNKICYGGFHIQSPQFAPLAEDSCPGKTQNKKVAGYTTYSRK